MGLPSRYSMEQFSAVHLDQQEVDGVGNRLNDTDVAVAQLIQDTALVQCHSDTEDHTQRQRDCHRNQTKANGIGNLFGQNGRNGHIFAIAMGDAQVTLEQVEQETAHLNVQRIFQTQLTETLVDLLLRQLI